MAVYDVYAVYWEIFCYYREFLAASKISYLKNLMACGYAVA